MKFEIFCLRLMCICFCGLTSVVGASPLNTIPPPVTDFFIPVNQTSVEPVRNPGDFIGRLYAPNPIDWKTRSDARPITDVTVTIVSGPRSGESIITDQNGYYLFPNVDGDVLHLLVEKEHFEPKEVIVSRSHPTKLANGAVLNYHEDVQQHPGNILIGQRWPDEVRFIFEETLVVHDLLYIEAGRPPKVDMGGFYSRGIIVIYRNQYAAEVNTVGILGLFAHEIAHAHQHATVSVDGSAWEIHGWRDTPEGIAYAEAKRKDWEEVGKAPYDEIYGNREGRGGIGITETAAETCAHYWSVDRWGGRTSYGFLEIEAPNRYKWAEKWVPINIDVQLPSKVVSIPDRNLAKAVRKALGLGTNAPITQRWMQRLTALDARESQIKNLTGLEHATRLRGLEVRGNQIRDIRPLAELKSLKELGLDLNPIQDITPLVNLTQLRWLLIGGSAISDFTPFANLNQLEGLSLWDNNIGDVTLLANKTKLTHLWLGENNISDIAPLANLTQLKVLELRGNQIRDVKPLANLKKLEELFLRGNPIQDASPLRTLLKQNPNLKLDIEIPPPSPVVLLEAAQRPPLYWIGTKTGTLHRLIGDEVENLAPKVKNVTKLAVDAAGGKLYWTEKTGERTGRIQRANLDGNPNVQLVKNLTSVPLDITLDAANGKIYLANAWGKVQQLNVDGSNFQPNLITGLEAPRHLALDVSGDKVYWTEMIDGSGRIRRANRNGSSVQNITTGLAEPMSLAITHRKIYWIERTTRNTTKLQRTNLNGTNRELLETLPSALTSIAVDTVRNALYLTSASGEIHRRNLDGSGYQPVVTGLVSPSGIALGIPATVPVPPDTPVSPETSVVDAAADVNRDKKVNKTDLLLVVTALGETSPANPKFDVNADGTVNIADVLLVIEALDDPVTAAAPSLGEIGTALDPTLLTRQLDILRAESDSSMKYTQAIAFLQGLLASLRPTKTQLLANYPNPFNPETWIPYQVAKDSDVKIRIYDAKGVLVHTLALGHQSAGFYTDKSRAAFWDGRNMFGERVASGVYFYQLQAGNVSSLRKMTILK